MSFLKSFYTRHKDFVYITIILVIGFLTFFPNLGEQSLVLDEVVYFQWAEHMTTSNDFLTPWAYGAEGLWIGKPPLSIWLMSLSFSIFGINNFAARFWSLIFGVGSCVLTFYLGKKFYSRTVGLLSALILITFATFFQFSRLATLDIPLTFFSLASIYFCILREDSKNYKFSILSEIFFGLALLTKQLTALLIPIILLSYFLLSQKSIRFLFTKRFTLFWLTGFLIFVPWLIYMHINFGSDFWDYYFVYHAFERMTETIEFHSESYFYYFNYLIKNEHIFWISLLPFALSLCVFRVMRKQTKGDILILGWILTILGIFSFAQTKLFWYIIPVFPAFSILLGGFLNTYFHKLKFFGILPLTVLLLLSITAPMLATQQKLILVDETNYSLGYNGRLNAVSIYDITDDSSHEIVIGEDYFDGNRVIAQLHFLHKETLEVNDFFSWYWNADTHVNSVAIGDVDGDEDIEIVTGGDYYNGTTVSAQVCIFDASTLEQEQETNWYRTGNTTVNSVAIGDVDGDDTVEIISGGYYNDGAREIEQLIIWTPSLDVKKSTGEYWGTTIWWDGNARINSVAIGDVNGDKTVEIVTGGFFQVDEKNAHIVVWNGKDLSVENGASWSWNDTCINSLAIGDADNDGLNEIISGGSYFHGKYENAQLSAWSGSPLEIKAVTYWGQNSDTKISIVKMVDIDNNGINEILTGSIYGADEQRFGQLRVWGMN